MIDLILNLHDMGRNMGIQEKPLQQAAIDKLETKRNNIHWITIRTDPTTKRRNNWKTNIIENLSANNRKIKLEAKCYYCR